MALTSKNGSLLRTGESLSSGLGCCCEPLSEYSICGNRCAFRVNINGIDSEMAMCGEPDLPAGWQVTDKGSSCGTSFPPYLFAARTEYDSELFPYEGIVAQTAFSSRSSFAEDRAKPGELFYSRSNRIYLPSTGGNWSFQRSGYTTDLATLTENEEYSLKGFYVFCDVGVFCRAKVDEPLCSLCNQLLGLHRKHYAVVAWLSASMYEYRYRGGLFLAASSMSFYGSLEGGGVFNPQFIYGAPFATQSCEEMNSVTRLPQYECYEPVESSCSPAETYYPDNPLEINVSMENGVSVGGTAIPWTIADTFVYQNDFEISFPNELANPGGITIYRADKCCCDPESYCNPLP